jgi:hypothetical protein
MAALTGSDQVYGQPDAASYHTTLRDRSDLYLVKPEVLYVPLRFTEKRSRFWWHQEKAQVLRDSPVHPLLARMKRRVEEEDERAYHLFVLAGRFTPEEVRELLSHSEMVHTSGYLDVLVAQIIPRTRNSGLAEFYLVDYVAPPGQLKPLVGLAHAGHPNGNGSMSREELVELLAGAHGQYVETPRKVEEAVKRIIEVKGN